MSCSLLFWLEPPGAEVTTRYDPTDGLHEVLDFRGCGADSHGRLFRGKLASFRIFTPEVPRALTQIGAEQEVDDACGLAVIQAGVRGERIKEFGREIELDPIEVRLWIDAFDSIFRQTIATIRPLRTFINLLLVGKSIPKITVADYLDIETTQRYAVKSFEIGSRL